MVIKWIVRFWVSILIVFSIALLSLLNLDNVNEIKFEPFPYADKLVHVVMYMAVTMALIFDFNRNRLIKNGRNIYVCSFLIAISFGGIMEILQGLTGYRSCDIVDFTANSIGAAIGLLLAPIVVKPIANRWF